MANYLDETGLARLWSKIKAYAFPNTGGTINGDVLVKGSLKVDGIEQTQLNLLRYQPSMVKMMLNDNYTEYSTSQNYFHPFYGEITSVGQRGNLTVETRTLDYADRTGARIRGICVGANISAVQIMASVRYLSNVTSETSVHTILYLAPADGSEPYVLATSVNAFGAVKFTQDINTIVTGIAEGDFLFIATYKGNASRDVDVIATGRATHMSAVAIG